MGMDIISPRECNVCSKKLQIPSVTSYAWKIKYDNKVRYACGYTCYKEVQLQVENAKKRKLSRNGKKKLKESKSNEKQFNIN